MGETRQGIIFRPLFNRAVRIQEATSDITGDAGAFLVRQAADDIGVPAALATLLDHRRAHSITHPLVELVLTRVLLLAHGWQDQDDADALRKDPAFRLAVSQRRGTAPLDCHEGRVPNGLPSQPTLSRMQSMLGSAFNRRNLKAKIAELAAEHSLMAGRRRDEVTFDVDSFGMSAHGAQKGSSYNGHFGENAFHPLAAYLDTGELLGIRLRGGKVHTADDIRAFINEFLPTVRPLGKRTWIRMDCGYASGALFDWLQARNLKFITRLPRNPVLCRRGKQWSEATAKAWRATPNETDKPRESTFEFWHRAKGWSRAVRVVAVMVERDPRVAGLFHHTFFLATNAARNEATSVQLLARYRARGCAEQRIGEFLADIAPTVSSASKSREGSFARKRPVGFAENEVSLLLAALAFNTLHALRVALSPADAPALSLRKIRERVLRTAATITRHARQVTVRINPVNAELWRTALDRIPPPAVGPEGVAA